MGPQPASLHGTGLAKPVPSGSLESKSQRERYEARVPCLVETDWSKFQQWFKVTCQPSYLASHYADKPWSGCRAVENLKLPFLPLFKHLSTMVTAGDPRRAARIH